MAVGLCSDRLSWRLSVRAIKRCLIQIISQPHVDDLANHGLSQVGIVRESSLRNDVGHMQVAGDLLVHLLLIAADTEQ